MTQQEKDFINYLEMVEALNDSFELTMLRVNEELHNIGYYGGHYADENMYNLDDEEEEYDYEEEF